ncbi:hypothetical protein ETB97_001655 [Aspergillus alliaceus]|uniref:Uncharacterized protein n=1 Tax=Petromyces alliaceus TaxID=209559 RepID=A0A5N7CQD9_PETAA|nr:hypothetical protein BDV23DRAFT_177499 [Aspergillus alliaceus]KAF5860366.1 hypothetical protein ETB97_001655 [Aspergillus burnettii]
MPSLDYLVAVDTGVRLVMAKYPAAQLYEVTATASDSRYVSHPSELDHLRFVFRAGLGTAFLASTTQEIYGPIQYDPEPWLDDVVIRWPVGMDASEADELLKSQGFTAPYNSMLLRHPVYPGLDEPYYIFHLQKERFVFVGVNSKKVYTLGISLIELGDVD